MGTSVRLTSFVLLLSAIIAVIAVVATLNGDDDTSEAATAQVEQPVAPPSPTAGAATPEGGGGAVQPAEQPKATPTESSRAAAERADDDEVPPLPTSDLIVYNTLDGQIALTEPNGANTWKITPDHGFYAWPVWSPDMSRIAFSGSMLRADGTEALSLFVYTLKDNRTRVVYTNQRGMGPILPEMPHYPYFSPDGTQLAFMASVPLGLTLFVADAESEDDPTAVLRNAPPYASWSPDSDDLLVHGGADHYLVRVQNGPTSVTNIGATAINYRTPGWSPSDGNMMVVSQDDSGVGGIYTTDAVSLDMRMMEETPGETAFHWSPDGKLLAVAHSDIPGGLVYQGIKFFSDAGLPQAMKVDGPVLAFYWSPDGSRLAYVTDGDSEGFIRWMVLNTGDGERWPIVDFVPSSAQAIMLRFFDQFAYSHSPWSPDSRSLVFSGAIQTEGVSASMRGQQPPRIIIANAGPVPAADIIAEGCLAFWSPR